MTAGNIVRRHGRISYACKCDCGHSKTVRGTHLTNGLIRSCGCLQSEASRERRLTHGKAETRAYSIWGGMKVRCYTETNHTFAQYGGRGIKVCDRWLSNFEAFLADMGEPPSRRHTLDRIDNDGDYEPDNCRWATKRQQANNRRSSRSITALGTTRTLAEWSRVTGVPHNTIWNRINVGWPPDEALGLKHHVRNRS